MSGVQVDGEDEGRHDGLRCVTLGGTECDRILVYIRGQ